MSTVEELAAEVRAAELILADLRRIESVLGIDIPRAERAVEGAKAKLTRAQVAAGTEVRKQRADEIQRLEDAITNARGGRSHV